MWSHNNHNYICLVNALRNFAIILKIDDDLSASSLESLGFELDDDVDDVHTFEANAPKGHWIFALHSQRGGKIMDGLPRCVQNDQFKLVHNAADSLLLEKAKAEIRHSLSQV